ncbi:MAG: shikimate kinase [Bacteroidetes bacterium]|jgi:shikimate kinase|nr:shikimate kinase [Bacteroidota bacterium]
MDKIYLVGLPGSGKSHTGKWLSHKLGWDFVDLDELIEKNEKKSIADLFETLGEDGFRDIEQKYLTVTFSYKQCVVSCGGGTPAWSNNMENMGRHGLTVYLNTELGEIERRLEASKTLRPLLKHNQSLGKQILELNEKRRPYYSRAKVIWNRNEPSEQFFRSLDRLLAIY